MYFRTRNLSTAMPPLLARSLFALVYLGYFVGCMLQLGDEPAWQGIVGLLLVAASALAFAVLAGSSFQRQAQEQDSKLDERELAQRNRAAYRAFSALAVLVVLGLFYMEIANDLAASGKANFWIPTTSDHWNALMWGFLILGFTLPAAFLAWEDEPPLED
jgi:small-conductance mechanosensitive channel